jgi:hypothetical protein
MGFNIDRVLLDAVTIHHHGIWQEEIRLGYLISAKQCRRLQTGPPSSFRTAEERRRHHEMPI